MSNSNDIPEWETEFIRVSGNAIYFIEKYWNPTHPDKQINLSEEEKQSYFNKYKKIPLLEDSEVLPYMKKLREAEAQGLKDWEIL